MIKLISAVAQNYVIGKGDKLAWHIKEELQFFKKQTEGHNLLMGDRTFNGLPGTLKNRKHYILTFDKNNVKENENVIAVTDPNEVFDKFKDSDEILFISGGKSIYNQFHHLADEIIISFIKHDAEGDVKWEELKDILKDRKQTLITENDLFVSYSYTR